MKVDLTTAYPLTDEGCRESTGKTISEWIAALEEQTELAGKRRQSLDWLFHATGRADDFWWPTTIWVERERMKGIVKKDGRIEGYNICVTKTIAAPIEVVFAAWLRHGPAKWWGDSPKVGEDNSVIDASGNRATATRVRENKDLRYKWETGGRGDITDLDVAFADKGKGKTGITLTHQRIQDRAEADGLRKAWTEAFDRLKKSLE